MKYIKLFEDVQISCWMVSVKKPNLEISLEKIGVDSSDLKFKNFIKDIRRAARSYRESGTKKMMINKSVYYSNKDIFFAYSTFRYSEYEYMGEIIITPEEIENWKIKQVTNKYNL